jgi:protocatechuate 3,4-dioxygenase alpha subunit
MATNPGTPSQTVGPFFRFALDRPEWSDLTRGGARGEKIVVEGQVLDGDGLPCDDAVVEIWQANAAGHYAHPEDTRAGDHDDASFTNFGRALTDAGGRYRFTSLRPGRVPAGDGAQQAPHINVTVFARGLLKQLTTRIYFADEPANETDPVLSLVGDPLARRTLLAVRQEEGSGGLPTYRFNVVLQGKGETLFFDI